MKKWSDDNRAWWDERVPLHVDSDFYALDAFRAGDERLRPFEVDELGIDVTDIDLLHLQCHIGTDTLAWARHGARVVGLDFSSEAVAAATGLAGDVGLADRAEFVAANVYDAVGALGNRQFDVVYTGIGALTWLPDIERWAETAAALVKPGGALYIVEIHPFTWVFADDTAEPAVGWDYFAEVHWDDSIGSYADRDAPTSHNRTHERNWGIGKVVSAVIASGLAVEFVHEHPIGVERYWPWMERVEGRPDLWQTPEGRPSLPLTWSLRARR
jgi:SAM-dependent methyltransferase